jgi:hypothetical protein
MFASSWICGERMKLAAAVHGTLLRGAVLRSPDGRVHSATIAGTRTSLSWK